MTLMHKDEMLAGCVPKEDTVLLGTVNNSTPTMTVSLGNYKFYLLCIVDSSTGAVLYSTFVPKALVGRIYCNTPSTPRTYLIGTTLTSENMPNADWCGRLYGIN